MRHVSLFSGVEAVGIAADHLGYETQACVESDEFCRRILRLRYPDAAIFDDVRHVGARELGVGMDLLSLGFPCQGLSSAGLGLALSDPRSALWFEGLRIITECRPRMVLIENVAVLRSRGLDVVVQGLFDVGYGCWWDCVPALAVGAPHLRDRIWITAVPLDRMPLLHAWRETSEMTRAGCRDGDGLYEMRPQATIKMAKEAAGAVKQPDGTTWLTALDSPLWPTPVKGDAMGSRKPIDGTSITGKRPDGSKAPVSLSMAVAHHGRLWPTATAHPRTHTPRPVHHGMQLANEVEREAQRMWPTPSRAVGTGGPGRSEHRTGGDNLRTVAASPGGPLSPDWVEWLQGLPVGWTDPDCAEPVHRDWLSEHGLSRTARDVPHRKQRLMAIGNSLVWRVALQRLILAHELLDRP